MVEEIWPNVAHSLRFCKVSVGNSCIFGKVGESFLEGRKYCHEKAHEIESQEIEEIVVIQENTEKVAAAEDHLRSEEDWNKHLCWHRHQGDRDAVLCWACLRLFLRPNIFETDTETFFRD